MSSFILWGPPGSGKTTMACTMCKLGYSVLLIDLDKKAEQMYNLKAYIEESKLTIITPKSDLVAGDLKIRVLQPKRAPIAQPKGYLEFIDTINAIQKGEYAKYDVLVVDSTTRLLEHLKRLILHVQGRGSMEIQDWGILLSNLEELFSTVFSLNFEHIILIAHDQTERDELLGTIEMKPLLDGQMKHKAGSYVEEMYFTQVETTKQGAQYTILTKPLGRIKQCRTSRNLNAVEPADFSIILKEEMK